MAKCGIYFAGLHLVDRIPAFFLKWDLPMIKINLQLSSVVQNCIRSC